MASGTKKWLKGCGIGCGVAVLLFLLLSIGGSVFMMRPFRGAVAVREQLDEQFGDQASYTPSAEGAITAERLEAFLLVREKLMVLCSDFGAFDESIERMDELEPDAPSKEIMSEFFQVTKSVFSMGPMMGEFYRVRNNALLEAGMGRGEYTYIYVMAYLDRLRPPEDSSGNQPAQARHPNERVRLTLVQMIRNQQAAVAAKLTTTDDEVLTTLARTLADQISRLEKHPDYLPWQGEVPSAITTSLAPFREQLDQVYCVNSLDHEFTENHVRFLGIHGN